VFESTVLAALDPRAILGLYFGIAITFTPSEHSLALVSMLSHKLRLPSDRARLFLPKLYESA